MFKWFWTKFSLGAPVTSFFNSLSRLTVVRRNERSIWPKSHNVSNLVVTVSAQLLVDPCLVIPRWSACDIFCWLETVEHPLLACLKIQNIEKENSDPLWPLWILYWINFAVGFSIRKRLFVFTGWWLWSKRKSKPFYNQPITRYASWSR